MIPQTNGFSPILSDHDLAGMRKSGKIAATILWDMVNAVRPGITTANLDKLAARLIKLHKANSAPKQEGFPGYTCISLNEIIAHGVPGKQVLRLGDHINIDVSIEHNGYYGDVAYTLIIGENGPESNPMLDCARQITMDAAMMSIADVPINSIAKVIEDTARSNQYSIIRNLCSHGVGKSLHAFPTNILNYYDPEETLVLREGMVIAWEPYISNGACRAIQQESEWNLTTHNKSNVAQFEHMVLVTAGLPEILTLL
ncbi:MAG: type I methionyl aminopeptidase [Cyclobacteriaceae bacterium]|nr:type I methionyl aminopeptidase [Cyclobacteriaceae bacterium]